MISISNKSKSRRPKFLLSFSITQLTNIPQSSGYCYCKWHLKDGTGASSYTVEQQGQTIDTNHQSKGVTDRIFVKNHRAKWNYVVDPPIKVKLASCRQEQDIIGEDSYRRSVFRVFRELKQNRSHRGQIWTP